jgi:hypothetical protein
MERSTRRHAALVARGQQQYLAQLQATLATQAATMQRPEQQVRALDGGTGPPRGMPGHKSASSPPAVRRPRSTRA